MRELLSIILRDTLKKEGKFSRTSLTMFSAWILAVNMALYDLYRNGFKYEVFVTFVGVALGSKLTDALGSRITTTKTND